jgi:hypothetical protein
MVIYLLLGVQFYGPQKKEFQLLIVDGYVLDGCRMEGNALAFDGYDACIAVFIDTLSLVPEGVVAIVCVYFDVHTHKAIQIGPRD